MAAQLWFESARNKQSIAVLLNNVRVHKEYYVQNVNQHPSAHNPILDGVALFEAVVYNPKDNWTYYKVRKWTRFNPDVDYEGCWWLRTDLTCVYEMECIS